jgi:hypothetical protein
VFFLWLSQDWSRAANGVRTYRCGADGAAIERNVDFSERIVPADGTGLPIGGSGDFGTSPFFGQLTGTPLRVCSTQLGLREVNDNSSRKRLVVQE